MGDLSASFGVEFAADIVCVQYCDTRGLRHAGERGYFF